MAKERIVPVLVRRRNDEDTDLGAASTDVLYDDNGKAHHRTRRFGVVEHEQAHTKDAATIVQLSKSGGDQILWVGDEKIDVARIEYLGPRTPGGHPGHHPAGHPGQPATVASGGSVVPNPFTRINRPFSGDLQDRVIASGPLEPSALEGFYKAIFRVGGKDVDPDFECVP